MKPALTDKLPEANFALASKSGWVNKELFSQWFDHFLNVVQPQARPQPSRRYDTGNIDVTKF